MKVLQINSTINTGSTGRIAEGIGLKVIENGGDSYIAYGRSANTSKSKPIKIGNQWDKAIHLLCTRLFDTHGFHSGNATNELIDKIILIQPDIIHLHNLHGYYLNIEVLFKFLKEWNKPVVWTLHDCWSFTGHCCYYLRVKCMKWQIECSHCPLLRLYPQSYFIDNSKDNFTKKKALFAGMFDLHLITVSEWLEAEVKQSFMKSHPSRTIYNGVDLNVFKPTNQESLKAQYGYSEKHIILGVANIWTDGKGLPTFMKLSEMLYPDQIIILVGASKKLSRSLPSNIIGVERTSSVKELSDYYNMADVFINPSIAETFGMTTAEAMACGTPSIAYDTSAMPELINESVGKIIPVNNYEILFDTINAILKKGKSYYSDNCRLRAEELFNLDNQFNEYLTFYKSLTDK